MANAAVAAGLRAVKGPEKRYCGGGLWERSAGGMNWDEKGRGNSDEAGGVWSGGDISAGTSFGMG